MYIEAAGGGGACSGATDYSLDSDCEFVMLYDSTNNFRNALVRNTSTNCTSDSWGTGEISMTGTVGTGTAPTGSPGGHNAADFSTSEELEIATIDTAGIDLVPDEVSRGQWVNVDAVSGPVYRWNATAGGAVLTQFSAGAFQAGMKGAIGLSGTTLSTSTWYFQATTWSAADEDIDIYVDGLADCDGTCITTATSHSDQTTIEFGRSQYDGRIYESWQMSRKLSAAEQCEICRCGFFGTATDRSAQCNTCALP